MNNGLIKDTEILMYNGELKKIQDIQIGDLVMSEDNSPLKVKNIMTDVNELYNVSHYHNDENYIVNKDFILSLKYKFKKNIIEYNNCFAIKWFDNKSIIEKSVKFAYNNNNKKKINKSAISYFENIKEDRQVNIKVCDYLNLSPKMQTKLYGIKSLILFAKKEIPYNSYIIGNIEGINLYGMLENTNISDKYKYNSINVRFNYLAGVIDGYGYNKDDKYILEIPELNSYIKDLIFMIKSISLNCIYKDNILIIYGSRITKIPTKKFKIKCNLNKYNNKLQVDNYGIDTYYTLEFAKKSKYILGNCIVVNGYT
jgi:replicative DNA helicase